MTSAGVLNRPRTPYGLFGVVLVGTGVYAYVMYSIDLPEEIEVYIAVGFALGLIVGRWPIVLAALPIVTAGFGNATVENALWQIIFYIYLPTAMLSIAAGVAVRVFSPRVVRRWRG